VADFQKSTLRIEERPDGLALLRLDVPGHTLNVLNHQVLVDLEASWEHVTATPTIKLLVIRSDKVAGFIAGADLQVLAGVRAPEEARALSALGQRVFNRLAALRVPTIGLIHGPCLGGGLELALACDYRIFLDHPKTQIGLPEVELGLVPAWGGTQRLPRIVGLERALQLILAGRRLTARVALAWGLADDLGSSEQKLGARLGLLTLRALNEGKRPLARLPLRTWRQRFLESNPLGRRLIYRATERRLHQRVPDDMPAPTEALRLIRQGIRQPLEAGLLMEQEAVGRLTTSSACRHLIELFLQREAARKLPANLAKHALPPIRRVGVVGAGTMGAGIAQLAALRGLEVIVQEVNETALTAGKARLAELFQKAVANQIVSSQVAEQKLAAIETTTNWQGFSSLDLVVEAVFEDRELKQGVFRELEKRTRPTTLLATNTSSLLVRQIQEGLAQPERVAGLHFFNPVHKMPLVEVVQGPRTGERTAAALLQWAIDLGKTPVLVQDSPGFVVNRILMPYLAEAVILLTEGLTVGAIDHTMQRFGMPMGPLELLDQVGLDVAAHVARAVHPLFAVRPAGEATARFLLESFEQLCERGWLGQKAGVGFYRYHGKVKKAHAAVAKILPPEPPGSRNNLMSGLAEAVRLREARERMVLLMVNEAAMSLGEGLAADAAAIDLAMVLGTGWAPHRGGPLHYGAERGLEVVVQSLKELAQRLGPRFEPSAALREQAAQAVKLRHLAEENP
jgi:3-hydroxyacyl-CoA dehydrogenase/enoyl-CoA hydratase/3-hydroxybutyryl-CoA epimerase